MVGRGIARHGYRVLRNGEGVGRVTSGTRTPFLERAVGLAYVPREMAEAGTGLEIEIRERPVEARVVSLPFYKRDKG